MTIMQENEKTYKYLVEKYGKETIDNRMDNIRTRILNYIDSTGKSDLYILNNTILGDAITDYFADIDRLKEFQGIEYANKNKITAYTVYWLLKRKPIQIACDECSDYKDTYPNEEFATTLIMKDYMLSDSELFKGMYPVQQLSRYILYFLKYRLTTAQSLELLLEGVHTGILMGIEYQRKHGFEDTV